MRLTVGPFFDKTDGVTPEVAITVTACKLTFMVDDANVPTLVLDTAPTASGGANDMVHVTGDDAGFYDLELAAANVNYLGRAMLAITDATVHCPVFHEFMILPAVIYDAMVLGTDLFDVSMAQILGTAVSSPATAGILDVNTKNINNVAAATPGASGGVLISGSNSGTTTFGALTVTGATTYTGATVYTGNVSYADGITVAAPSTGNRAGLSVTGNGTGAGILATAGATGIGVSVVGGGTSGDGIKVVTTSGHGVNLAPVGTSMHGLLSTGGNGGTSDGVKAVAGTGGIPIRGEVLLATGAVTAAVIADNAIDAATYAADTATYQAKVWMQDDNGGTADRYIVCWFKNGNAIFSGITSPTIQVVKAADGTDLVASTAMTQIGSTGTYRYTESTNRIVNGTGYVILVTASIDSATRTWPQPMGRDS